MARITQLSTEIHSEALPDPAALFMQGLETTGASVQLIPIAEIRVAPQFRTYFDPHEIDKLAQTIRDNGFQGAVMVHRFSSQEQDAEDASYRYQLIVGESRLRAMQQLGELEIPAEVKDELSDKEIRRLQADENLIRNDFNPVEEANTILAMMADELDTTEATVLSLLDKSNNAQAGKTQEPLTHDVVGKLDQLTAVLHRYKKDETATLKGFLNVYRGLQGLPTDILVAIRDDLPYTKAIELKSIKDEAVRKQLLQEIKENGLTIQQIRQRKKDLKQQHGQIQTSSKADTPMPLPLPRPWHQFVHRLSEGHLWQGIAEDTDKQAQAQDLLQQLKALLDA